jgi:hypothetical protein
MMKNSFCRWIVNVTVQSCLKNVVKTPYQHFVQQYRDNGNFSFSAKVTSINNIIVSKGPGVNHFMNGGVYCTNIPYEKLFHTKVIRAAFLYLHFRCAHLWRKEIDVNAAHKMLMKLTTVVSTLALVIARRSGRRSGLE